MGSTFSGLNAVIRGIYSQQVALNTVGHNIANANTEGYSRQTVNMSTTNPETVYGGGYVYQLGTGVTVDSVTRARDAFTDKQMWKELSSLGYGEMMQDTLGKVEGIFREPSETGIQTVLDEFWSSLQALGANASDDGIRTALRQRGVELVDAVKHTEQQLRDMIYDINDVLDIKVDKINQISSEILSLNKQIVNIETTGDHANDLRDRRDLLVDQLSKIGKVSVTEDTAGNYVVQIPGVTLVDGNRAAQLKTVDDSNAAIHTYYGYEVKMVVVDNDQQQPVQFTDGEIKALLDSRDSDMAGIKSYLDKLDTISEFLLKDFNYVHRQGYGTDNSTGVNFFGDDGVDYSDSANEPAAGIGGWLSQLQVNPALFDVLTGTAKIAAKTAAADGNAAGDNAVHLAQALKVNVKDSTVLDDAAYDSVLGDISLDTFYSSFIGELGVQQQNAIRLTENQETLVNQIYTWRESVSGVNLDEEMTNMIRFQKGYNAAARVLTAMDEMLDKLINGTGVVGR